MDRFVCCRREPKQPTELTVCPGRMVRDSKKRLCSSHGNCPSNYNCIRKNHERIGICCKHKKQQPVLKRKPIQSQCLFTEDICYADSERTIMNSHVNNFTNCPSGFMCINEKICCPNTWTLKLQVPQLCGDYWKPIMDNTNAFPIPCSPNEAICEAGQSCRFSAILRIHICCRPLFLLRNFNDSFQYDNQNMING
uniref:WAP domain-containing protein n=1 Tax=Panagrolaimus sp. JU765 TaxID=591449 RepID=A0AC34Q1W7_9BILA